MTLRNLPRLGFSIVRFIFEAAVRSLTQALNSLARRGSAPNNPIRRYHFNIGPWHGTVWAKIAQADTLGYTSPDKLRRTGPTQMSSSWRAMKCSSKVTDIRLFSEEFRLSPSSPLPSVGTQHKDAAGHDFRSRNGQLGLHLLSNPFPP